MELLQLTYFCDAAQTQNFSRTARKYGVPSSDISQTIHRLEAELGVALFDRKPNRAQLNEMGKLFAEKVRPALALLEEARACMSFEQEKISGEIRLQILAHRNTVTKGIERFRLQYPQVYFTVSHQPDPREEPFHLIISDEAPSGGVMEKRLLIEENMALAMPKNSPLLQNETIRIEDLRTQRFITMQRKSSMYRITNALCKAAGFAPNIAIETDDPFYIRKYVEMGMGIAFVPEKSWQGLFSENTVCWTLPDVKRMTYAFWDKDAYVPKAVRLFLNTLWEVFRGE